MPERRTICCSKANDGAKTRFVSDCYFGNNNKTPYWFECSVEEDYEVNVGLRNLENCAVNVDYNSIVSYISPSVDAVCCIWLLVILEQSAKNLKNAQLYGGNR